MPPPFAVNNDDLKEPRPKSLKEVPGYIKRVVSKFCYRLLYIFRLVWETKPWILFAMTALSVLSGALPVVQALVGKELLNALAIAFTTHKDEGILALLILQFICLFANSLISNINNIVSRISGELVANHVNVKLMKKAREIDLASFDRPEFYAKLENASREAGMRPIQILNASFSVITNLIGMVSYVVILWAVSPSAPLVIVALSIPSACISFHFRRKNFMYIRHRSKDRRQLRYYSDLMTNKDMVKEIRIFGLSSTFINRYKEIFAKYFKGLRSLFLSEGGWNTGMSLVTTVANCILFLYIANKVIKGELQVGDYSLYTGALNSIAWGVGALISTTATIYEGTLFIDNVITFINEKQTVVPSLTEPREVTRHIGHKIEFKNVSFRYPGTEKDVLSNINITINSGDTVVLVGLNGAGKTTLLKILTRLYDPTEGVVLLDGVDIKEYDTESLYQIFGIIFQDFGKYAVSVAENIAFGQVDRGVIDHKVRECAENASADAFIKALPEGYDTALMRYFEDNGTELSIGQWQKLTIARAFYSDSDIMILDEPTASLDAIAEQEIYNQFDMLRQDKTTIFVSHRLSSAVTATKIIVLENGKVVEEGNHKQLMAQKGKYHDLFTTQAKRYIEEEKI